MRRAAVVIIAAVCLSLAVSTLAGARGLPGSPGPPVHRPAPVCYVGEWKTHHYGPCGWHTVPHLIWLVFKAHAWYARCVAWKETRYQWWRRNVRSGAAGLFQFMPSWWRGKWNPYNPVLSTLHAFAASGGWHNGRYYVHGTYWAPWSWECG